MFVIDLSLKNACMLYEICLEMRVVACMEKLKLQHVKVRCDYLDHPHKVILTA